MKILVLAPASVPTYFNAGHHLPLWELASYLRTNLPDVRVDAVDASVLNYTWKEIADLLLNQYDLVCVLNEFDLVDGVRRLSQYAAAISPASKILTFGRTGLVIPHYFRQYPLDAVVASGDDETAVLDYVRALRGEIPMLQCNGLLLKDQANWHENRPGRFLDSEEWEYPSPLEVPLADYARISARPENRFAALPGMKEWTVKVARGCPVGCEYCLVPMTQGRRERRRSVESVLKHILEARQQVAFDYVSMFAPTFTLNKSWVYSFCEQIADINLPWKCCTTVRHLTEDLVAKMGASGCIRISVGLETLDPPAQHSLPMLKQVTNPQFEDLARWCSNAEVELNCFIMVGMPGQTAEGLRHTFDFVTKLGAKVRPTAYTPYHLLQEDATEEELSTFFTRHLQRDVVVQGLTPEEFYGMEFAPD